MNTINNLSPYHKSYISKDEAKEYIIKKNIKKLPRIGKQIITVKSNYEMNLINQKYHIAIGRDENGFYLMYVG